MICDHPESARTYETLIYPKACQRADERVVRCQRCGAVIYTVFEALIVEGEDKP